MIEGCIPWPKDLAEEYVSKGYWRNIPLGQEFDNIAEVFPDRVALVLDEEKITYSQLKEIADRLAVSFIRQGLSATDRVVVQLPNILEFVYCYFAFLKIGVIPVMCMPPFRQTEIEYIATKSMAKGYVIPDTYRKFNFLQLAQEIRKAVPSIERVFVAGQDCYEGQVLIRDLLAEEISREEIEVTLKKYRPDPFDAAVFLLSGGTTGLPKIIPRTHNDYLYNAKITGLNLGVNKDTVYLAIAPLVHNMTLSCPGLMGTLLRGGKVVLTTVTDPENLCKVIEKDKITNVPLVPALILNLLNFEKRKDYDISSLKVIISGGSKLNPEVAKRVKPEIGCDLVQQFGMAEGLLTMTQIDDVDEIKFNTVGRPVSPADQIKIIDDDGNEVQPGETGELCCRGPYTIRGYYAAPEHNRNAFTEDGFYKSGDMFKIDPKTGCLIVEGRKKDLINRGGEKINCEEIENMVLSHPKVDNASMVAMPDPVMGEKACIYVTLKQKGEFTLAELNAFLLEKKIAKFKLPERLEVIEQFPLTTVGKISKKDLRKDIENKIQEEESKG